MRISLLAIAVLLLASGCARESRNPDQIREDAAKATAKVRTDAKAVAEGVREGWKRGELVDLNSASHEKLLRLPGITDSEAQRIISNRPYRSSDELVTRRVLTRSQYDQIKSQIEVR